MQQVAYIFCKFGADHSIIIMKKNLSKYFYVLYILALAMVVIYLIRDEMEISEGLANLFYYLAIGIFGLGVVRIVYLAIKR